MKPTHILLGVFCTLIWGFSFVMTKIGLDGVPPLLFTAERFALACLPALFLPRPPGLTSMRLLGIGCFMFLGQYAFLFVAMSHGMPPGLASITLQIQAFLTMIIATLTLGERPEARQVFGALLAFLGLGVIAATTGTGSDIPLLPMGLILMAALSWALGNVLLKQAGASAGGGTLAGVAWLSLVPPLPALALSLIFETPTVVFASLTHMTMMSVLALVYIVALSTWLGFVIWGKLMALYPASTVAPFTLLVPFFGASFSALVLGENFAPMRLVGAALIVAGLAAIALRRRSAD